MSFFYLSSFSIACLNSGTRFQKESLHIVSSGLSRARLYFGRAALTRSWIFFDRDVEKVSMLPEGIV